MMVYRDHALSLYLVLTILTSFGSSQGGATCGGILEGNAGQLIYPLKASSIEAGSSCIWLIKVVSMVATSSIQFSLDSALGDGSILNLYPSHEPTDAFLTPITLNHLNSSMEIEVGGSSLVVILSETKSSSIGVSFSWKRLASASKNMDNDTPAPHNYAYDAVSANYVDGTEGRFSWSDFGPQHQFIWALNLRSNPPINIFSSMTLSILAEVYFPSANDCESWNPCECFYFGMYKVTQLGQLIEVNRICGHSLNFTATELPEQMITFVYIRSTQETTSSLALEWKLEQDETITTTTTTTGITCSSEGPGETTNFDSTTEHESTSNSASSTTTDYVSTWNPTSSTTTDYDSTSSTILSSTSTTNFDSTTTNSPRPFKCPVNETIFPCYCLILADGEGLIRCQGPEVSQESIDKTLQQTREVNNVAENTEESLYIRQFYIENTDLVTLDLVRFMKMKFYHLDINYNPKLRSLIGPQPIESFEGGIDTQNLYMHHCALTDEGLGDTLKYFSPDTLQWIILSANKLEGMGSPFNLTVGTTNMDLELLAGLSSFKNLDLLELSQNKIQKVEGGQFKKNGRLRHISLSGNDKPGIGPDAFLLDYDDDENLRKERLFIDLMNNEFTSGDFSSENSIHYIKRPVTLLLGENRLESLDPNFFEPFLNSNDDSELLVDYNPIICGPSLKWLKDQKDRFERRVKCPCSNDPGYNCFTSDLV